MVSSRRHAISCILLVLSLVIFAQAQTAPDKVSGATVTGKVTIKGKAAPGVAVVLVLNLQGEQRATRYKAFTDDTGTYRITNVPPGKYSVQATTPAFVAVDHATSPFGKSVTLLINKDETVENIDFDLLRGGVITGKVTDSDGRPLIEEKVSISIAESNPNSNFYGHRGTQTDDRGVYRLFGIPPGNYKVSAGTNELSPSWEIPRIRQTFHPDTTDVSQATTINVTEGSETTNVDITVKVGERDYSIRGRIIDDTGQPVANVPYGITVYLNPNTRSGLSDGSVSNSNGEFKWEHLGPGKYSVYVNNVSDSAWYAEEAPFEVTDRDITDLVVKLKKATTTSGVIILEGTDDKSVLAKLSGARVVARIVNENRTTSTHTTGTLSDGSFRFNGLSAGVAIFGVEGKGLEVVRVERNGVVQPAGITIRDREQISGLRLIVHYYNGSIRGVLKVDNDEPLPANSKSHVSLKRLGEPVRQFDESSPYRSSEVDARGQFVVEGLAPGTYEVTGQSQVPNEPRGQVLVGKQQVTVTDGAVVNITVTLQPYSAPNRP